MGGAATIMAVMTLLLWGTPSLTHRTPWLAPKGTLLSRAALLRERLHNGASGPEDILPRKLSAKESAVCLECELVVVTLQGEIAIGASEEALEAEGIAVCAEAVGYTQTFCEGYVPMIMPIIRHILETNEVAPADACGELLTFLGCTTNDTDRDWSITLQGEKPSVVPIPPPEADAPQMKVLHLADIHLDPYYQPGSNAACLNELCCREESGEVTDSADEAWYWGDYRHCGTPVHLLESLLVHASTMHSDIDYVIWTGDAVPHNMWSTSQEWNVRVLRDVKDMIRRFFPEAPVFPVVGNHEMSPLDQFPGPGNAPEELAADWLYEELASEWETLVPNLNVSTIKHAAYYSVLLRPGFRIISFNTMFGYSTNIWLVEDSHDPASELAWLEGELNKAEAAGELVHILGHVPPGLLASERTWSREYNRIIVRYENIIRGQFFGHTHYDEFEVFHEGGRPVSVAYIAPSQTPWYDLNPAYRIYHIDGDRPNSTWAVLDHSTYVANLTEAHETDVARWYQLYSARDLYGMEGLTPQDWQDLADRMAESRDLFNLYYRNFVSGGDPYLEVGCDDLCYAQRLCDVVTSDRNDLDHCTALRMKIKS